MNRTIHPGPAKKSVDKWRDVSVREANNQASGHGLETVVVSVGADVRTRHIASPLVDAVLSLDADKAIEVIGTAKQSAHIHSIVGIPERPIHSAE